MKNRYITLISAALLVMGFGFTSCSDWVQNVPPLEDVMEDETLNREDTLPLLLNGVKGQFGARGEGGGIGWHFWRATAFGDELDMNPRGGAPDHKAFSQAITFDLDFIEGDWRTVQRIRFHADDLIRRADAVGITSGSLENDVYWWGYTVGGIMRMMLADHFGLDKDGSTPGAVISDITGPGPEDVTMGSFESSSAIRAKARTRLMAALDYDPGGGDGVGDGLAVKIVHSLIARTYLFDGDYNNAEAHALLGLEEGDDPFVTIHNGSYQNYFWYDGGRDYSMWAAPARFLQYVKDDPKEGIIVSRLYSDPNGASNQTYGTIPHNGSDEPGDDDTENAREDFDNPNERIPLWENNLNGTRSSSNPPEDETEVYYIQDRYDARDDPMVIVNWQETSLILAECALVPSLGTSNSYTGSVTDALVYINQVRESYMLDPLTEDDMLNYDNPLGGASTTHITTPYVDTGKNITGPKGLLIEERDKTLWLMGTRLVDQHRFNLWHLPDPPSTWWYIPVSDSEVLQNPNLSR